MSFAVYNPNGHDVGDLPVIYGFNNGGPVDFLTGVLIAQDGTVLGSHICSNEYFMYGDLGITEGEAPQRHVAFQKHYPDGYRMDFVPRDKLKDHAGLNEALRLNTEQHHNEKNQQEG